MHCSSTSRFTVLSSSGTAEHPENTPAHFTNTLPDVLTLCPSKRYCLKVHSIFLTRQLLRAEDLPPDYAVDEVRVHFAQLRPSYESAARALTHCVARLPFPDADAAAGSSAVGLFHAFTHPIGVPFDPVGPVLYELTFSLSDQLGRPLPLRSSTAQPTIINLSLEEMDVQDTFSLTVSSLDSSHEFPANRPWSFHTNFATQFELDPTEWEVALHHVAVPRDLHMEHRLSLTFDDNLRYAVDSALFDDWNAMFHYFAQRCRNLQVELVRVGSRLRLIPSGRFPLHSLELNPPLARALGLSPEHLRADGTYRLNLEELPLNKPFDLPGSAAQGEDNYKTPQPEHAVVCCSLVRPSMLGSETLPLVDVLPTKELGLRTTEARLYELPSLIFRPLAAHVFSSFSVKLLSLQGVPLYASTPDGAAISFTFVFERRRRRAVR